MLVLEVKMIGFYDSGHEAYQFEGNEELNNIQAHIFTFHKFLISWVEFNGQIQY